jgi:ABC-type nitrate/sulfonate/bicarbonate transport system permease component
MNVFIDLYRKYESTIIGTAFILLILLVWQAIPLVTTLSKGMALFFTTPLQIIKTFFVLMEKGEIQKHFYVSAIEFVTGLGLSIVVGLPLGIVVGRSPVLNALLDPFITSFNATPRVVFLPLVLLWLGIGIWSKVAIVFFGALFPLLINTYEGVRNVDRVLVNVVRSFGANEWQIMRMVVLPNSLPYVITGLRLAIGRAILGVVVGEFFGASKGLGFMIAMAAGSYLVDVVFVGVALFMGISLVLTMSVKMIESRLSRWRPEQVKTF